MREEFRTRRGYDPLPFLPVLTGRVVAVTGCTTGTGYAVCRAMAQKGAHVVMLNRPSERATAAEAQAHILKSALYGRLYIVNH